MKTIATMATAALTIVFLPAGCTTTGAAKARATEQPSPSTANPAAAVIRIDGLS